MQGHSSLLLLYYISMPLIHYLEESVSRTVYLLQLNYTRIRAVVNIFFTLLKVVQQLFIYQNSMSLYVSFIRGSIRSKKSLINVQQKLVNTKKLYTTVTVNSASYSIIAFTFSGSIYTPTLALTINPRYFITLTLNLHLLISSYRPTSLN